MGIIKDISVPKEKLKKPCHVLGYCVYGYLVEEFPFNDDYRSCKVFGHDCPVFHVAENLCEEY